jgi:anti-sigma factor RsiW
LFVVFSPGPYFDMDSQEVFASHLLVLEEKPHLLNIQSSDPAVVQLWLRSRLDFTPLVHDLSAAGYSLAGARLDYMHDRPVAALVYRHDGHVIDLFTWPGQTQEHGFERDRLYLAPWNDGGLVFWAISDLNSSDLAQFANLYQKARP